MLVTKETRGSKTMIWKEVDDSRCVRQEGAGTRFLCVETSNTERINERARASKGNLRSGITKGKAEINGRRLGIKRMKMSVTKAD